jgi:hypothetical protein
MRDKGAARHDTFTDLLALDPERGVFRVAKVFNVVTL